MSTMPVRGPSHNSYTACFSVFAHAEPSVMPRVLEVFAKRGMVPTMWHSTVCGAAGEELHIDLQIADLDRIMADVLARSLRQLVSVECVLTSEKRYTMSA
jgi:acetolactate synthase regulatory subunit